MAKNQKLELQWYHKNEKIEVEPRIMLENDVLSYWKDSPNKNLFNLDKKNDLDFENMLIHGDNLLALKALESNFTNKVKCIYIDPPYNTGSAFEHYDDNLEHSTWLSLMRPRLEILRNLLSNKGVIFVHIDNNEFAYLKVLCDEIFGRNNFIETLIPIMNPRGNQANKHIATMHEYILVYAKSHTDVKINKLMLNEDQKKQYKHFDTNTGMYFREIGLRKRGAGSRRVDAPNQWYPIFFNPNSKEITTEEENANTGFVSIWPMLSNGEEGRWRWSYSSVEENKQDLLVRKVKRKDGYEYDVFQKDYLTEQKRTKMKSIIDENTNNEIATRHLKELGIPFDNPKPEGLISQLISIGSDEGDIVLDSFLGSGTTIAVAHKMNRNWIGIEMGNQAYTHCKIRIDKVIDNEDQGEITNLVDWKGGGGYKFYELAPTLIKEDNFGQTIINPEYNAEMLAAAVSKHEGYTYNPDSQIFWKQASNDNKSYLYVTTKHVNREYLVSIDSEMKEDEYLIIVCKSYDSNITSEFRNIEIKKIPQSLLNNCEFGVENYNLNIIHPPVYEEEDEIDD
jgi:adenine-specific DNA-methyltransferase